MVRAVHKIINKVNPMRTIKIRTDASVNEVPILIPFQGAPGESFSHGEEVLIQLVNNDGEFVGDPKVRAVVETHDADDTTSAWYEAYIPVNK